MLEELRVTNFAIIEKMGIKFGRGLNVITGETGAGKSIMIQAITGLIGERLDQTVIRTGKEKAMVEGVFQLSTDLLDGLKSQDLCNENPIIIRRIIGVGRTGYINDSPVTIQTLKSLGKEIIELLGQHEQQSLFRIENHRHFLDSFLRLDKQLQDFGILYYDFIDKGKNYEEYCARMEKLKEKQDLLSYQLNEIETADLRPAEEEILTRELDLLKSAEKRKSYINEIVHYFYDGKDSAYELLSRVGDLLGKLALVDPLIKKDYEEMKDVIIRAEELGRDISSYKENINFSTDRIDEILSRLDTIRKLRKKYGNLETIGMLRERLGKELSEIKDYPFDLDRRKKELDDLESRVRKFAKNISTKRKTGAKKLQKIIKKYLNELEIKAQFFIRFGEIPFGPYGIDNVEFYVSANPGEEPKPLRKVASGGELSRIVLVLKSILADFDRMPILIFDEIDSGIGGRVGELVGLKLSEIAKHHQIICITHLPQIAKFADCHYLVEKYVEKNRTFTRLKMLRKKEKVFELARMIEGTRITESALKKAQEMLEEAHCLRSQI